MSQWQRRFISYMSVWVLVTSQKVRIHHVIPAKAGIQLWPEISLDSSWTRSGIYRNDNRAE